MPPENRVLAIHAHPDDVEIQCSGTLALLKARGVHVTIATMTPGDCGSAEFDAETIASMRRDEAKASADLIGADSHCLEFRDLAIFDDDPSRRRVVEFLRRVRPDVVLAPPPVDYMADHEATSRLVRDALFAASVPNYVTKQWEPAPHLARIPHFYYVDPVDEGNAEGVTVPAGFLVDVSEVYAKKRAMLACHASQRDWLRKQHGMDEYLDSLDRWSSRRGREIGVEHAEGFRQYQGPSLPEGRPLASMVGPGREGWSDGMKGDCVLDAGTDGRRSREALRVAIARRLLFERGDEVTIDRCPRCHRLVRTPKARQRFGCGHDGHGSVARMTSRSALDVGRPRHALSEPHESNPRRPPMRIFRSAIVLCLMGLTTTAFADDDAAIAAVKKAGGKVERDEKEADKPVTVVNLGVTQADDAALEPVKGFAKLKKLTLNGTKITDAGLDHVKGLASLQKLYLVDTKIDDAGVEKLKEMKELRILSLAGTGVTDAGLEHLKGMINLETVFLHGTKVTDEGVKKLKESLPKLKVEK